MSIGQSLNLRGMTFNSGPRFFAATHYLKIIGRESVTTTLECTFPMSFISDPGWAGGTACVFDENGDQVTISVSIDPFIREGGLVKKFTGTITANPYWCGSFEATICLIFVGNGTW